MATWLIASCQQPTISPTATALPSRIPDATSTLTQNVSPPSQTPFPIAITYPERAVDTSRVTAKVVIAEIYPDLTIVDGELMDFSIPTPTVPPNVMPLPIRWMAKVRPFRIDVTEVLTAGQAVRTGYVSSVTVGHSYSGRPIEPVLGDELLRLVQVERSAYVMLDELSAMIEMSAVANDQIAPLNRELHRLAREATTADRQYNAALFNAWYGIDDGLVVWFESGEWMAEAEFLERIRNHVGE